MGFTDTIRSILGMPVTRIGDLDSACAKVDAAPDVPGTEPERDKYQILPEYHIARKAIEKGLPVLLVTGGAGTGKTTFIRYLSDALGKSTVILAPTGVAALNIGGSTLHSFFKLPPRLLRVEDIPPPGNRNLYDKIDVLVIDEISMVRVDVMDAVEARMRKEGRDSSKPFGGAQVVLVGDLFQLPPVVPRDEESIIKDIWRSEYFFSATGLRDATLGSIDLKTVLRQKDRDSIDLLNDLRWGNNLDHVIEQLNNRCFGRQPQDDGVTTLTTTVNRADQINSRRLSELPGESRTYAATTSGKFDIATTRPPSPARLELKDGAQVMFTRNDEGHRWVNGTVGIVRETQDDSIQVEVNGSQYPVSRVKWEKFRYTYDRATGKLRHEVEGQFIQFPLMLAWALTIHKSQGKTLSKVHLDLGNRAFAPGQVYVALSRCRSLDDVTLHRRIGQQDIQFDPVVHRFYRKLREIDLCKEIGPLPI